MPHGQRSEDLGRRPRLPLHEVDNVYVIDASVHVTNGGFNPGADHPGQRLSRLGPPVESLEGLEGALMRRFILAAAPVVVAVVLMVPGASLYYESGAGKGCTGCHEMQPVYDQWHASSHRGVGCEKCHGGALTLDASFHWNNATRVYSHLRGDLPERDRVRQPVRPGHDCAVPGLPPPGVCGVAVGSAQRDLRADLSRQEAQRG